LKARSNTNKYGIWQTASVLYTSCLGKDPKETLRDWSVPVGLENLGATCYCNSFLQCLFMNTSFRSSFLKFDAACIKEDDSVAFKAISTLQELFVRMQNGPWKALNPGELLKLFELDIGYQQDMLEFVKLMFEYLSHYLKKSDDPQLKNLIETEFRGSFLHVTCCDDCGSCTQTRSYFYEISLPIVPPSLSTDQILTEPFNVYGTGYKFAYNEYGNPFSIVKAVSSGSVELNWCLNNYFSPEVLCDSNQFYCNFCQQKSDATRTVYLENLPPVLNLQLMRFIYDAATHTKKKLHTIVEIPKILEFQLMASSGSGCATTVAYELSGIVSHFGENTHSGHYIAELRDEVTGAWYKFNDKAVELMKHSPTLTSKTAYMLLYFRKDKRMHHEPKLSQTLQKSNSQETKEFWNNANDYSLKREKLEAFIKTRKDEVKELFKTVQMNAAYDDKDTGMILSENWLRNWIMGLANSNLPDDDYEYSEWHPGKIENAGFLCKHNLLDPNKRNLYLRIHPVAWSYLSKRNGFDIAINASQLCEECSKEKIKSDLLKKSLDEEKSMILQARKGEMMTLKEFSKLRVFPIANSSPPCGKFYLIPDSWRKNWFSYCKGETNDPAGPIDTSSFICKHDKLQCSPYPAVSHFKEQGIPTNSHGIMCDIVPSEWDYLVTTYGLTGPEIFVSINEPSGPARLITNTKSKAKIRPWSAVSVECSPELCHECALEFSSLNSQRQQALGKIVIEEYADPPSSLSNQSMPNAAVRSTRSAPLPKVLRSFSLDFDGSSMIRSVKEQMVHEVFTEEVSPAPFSLYFNGRHIDESLDDSRCSDLGISKGSSLQFVLLKESDDKLDDEAVNEDINGKESADAPILSEAVSTTKPSSENDNMDDEKGFEGSHLYKIVEKLHGTSSEGSKQSFDPVLIWHFMDPRRGLLGLAENFENEYEFRLVAKNLLESQTPKTPETLEKSKRSSSFITQKIVPVASRLHALLSRITDQNHAIVLGSTSSSKDNLETTTSSSQKSVQKKRKRN
jgi:ubiquitin carboxyl-terminal hydrolase 48